MSEARTWKALERRIVACRACPRLVAWREAVARTKRRTFRQETYWGKPVPGFGDPRARVLIVGLAPAAHGANRTGRMFTGDASGDFLFRALYEAGFANQPVSRHREDGLTVQDVYITAVCRCVPPKNRPTTAEIRQCLPFLVEEIRLLAPTLRVFVALGRIAFEGVLQVYRGHLGLDVPKFPFAHAAVYTLPDGRTLVASYHPSRQNTQTGRLTFPMFMQVWEKVHALLEGTATAPGARPSP